MIGGCSIEGETSGCGVKAPPERMEIRAFSLLLGTQTLPIFRRFRHGCICAAESALSTRFLVSCLEANTRPELQLDGFRNNDVEKRAGTRCSAPLLALPALLIRQVFHNVYTCGRSGGFGSHRRDQDHTHQDSDSPNDRSTIQ